MFQVWYTDAPTTSNFTSCHAKFMFHFLDIHKQNCGYQYISTNEIMDIQKYIVDIQN